MTIVRAVPAMIDLSLRTYLHWSVLDLSRSRKQVKKFSSMRSSSSCSTW